jgi:hypothetical protein
MSRILRFGTIALLLLSSTGIVNAGWPAGAWYDWKTTWHRNNMWPEPFVAPDRDKVYNTMSVFVNRGWERQCLMGEQHFSEDKKLSSAGMLKVRYILTQTPADRRTIYIERGASEDATKARVDMVQQAVAEMTLQGPMPEVLVSNLQNEGTSAEYLDAVNRGYYKSMPVPRLPASGDASSGSSNTGG